MGDTSETTTTVGLTPEQQTAQRELLNTALQGQQSYGGNFDITPDVLSGYMDLVTQPGGEGLNDFLNRAMETGLPTELGESATQARRVADAAARRAAVGTLAEGSKYGGKFSTQAAGTAGQRAAEVAAQAELAILQERERSQQLARQRQLAAADIASRLGQAAQQGVLNVAQLELAANQWQEGMDYEEWKRQNPDVYQILESIWGRNVDFMMEKNPTAFGSFLSFASGVIGSPVGAAIITAMTGGAAAPLLAASVAGAAGSGTSGFGLGLENTTWGRG